MSTPENRRFWAGFDEAAAEFATWPDWKKVWLLPSDRPEPDEEADNDGNYSFWP